MNSKKLAYFSVCLGAIAICIAAATHFLNFSSLSSKGTNMPPTLTLVRLGDPKGSDLAGVGSSVDNHPTGAMFYQREWTGGKLGVVEYEQGKHSFTVENVLGVIGFADKDEPEGIYSWDISFGVSAEQADAHQLARDRVMEVLAKLRAAGWKRYIDVEDPRLTGKQAWNFAASRAANWAYSLDSTYTPTMDEWIKAKGKFPKWVFYADGVYLEFSIFESNMGGFVGKSTYLLGVNVKNEYAFYGLGYFPGDADKIHNWKALLPAELEKYHAMRFKTEAALKAQGFTIDTTYQDPPIKALQSLSGTATQ
ncbi:hypothetical protein PQR57_15930 [Paraburkholderia dipogonis]|uniref:Uncharacterized protein n=1 Tax=Paraburkholderia dipogonis TaxID=1211383 RepID=A0ABW9AQZ6_9BURK